MHPLLPSDKVLIIDDSPEHLSLLTMILELHGYDITIVQDGVKALHMALENPPDIILLDILLPEFDGFEVCKFFKHYDDTRDIPIIFISGCEDAEFKLKAFASGGDDYLTKPFQIDEAIARINNHLKKTQAVRRMNHQINELEAYSSTVAHDIKNPLNLMQGFADQLLDNWDIYAEKDKKYILKVISRNSSKASAIVDELLALSSIRQSDVTIEQVDMADVFFQVEQRLENWLSKFEGELILPDDWPIVEGYSPWIEEVWVNYLTNAFKYGSAGQNIEVGYTILDDLTAKFWVKDDGPGLSEEDQAIVFKQYVRVKGTIHQDGYGLGLAIVKRIINKLNGDVGVKSKQGEGCLFYFTLPLPLPESEESSLLELTQNRY